MKTKRKICPMCEVHGCGPCEECDRLNRKPRNPKPPVKLPRAAVMFADPNSLDFKYGMTVFSKRHKKHPHFTSPVVIIACRNRQKARAWVKLGGNYWALVDVIATAMAQHRQGRTWPVSAEVLARSVLQALHLIP